MRPMKAFLVKFVYDYYCQGLEEGSKTLLIYADSYQLAVEKVETSFFWKNARDFENLTFAIQDDKLGSAI